MKNRLALEAKPEVRYHHAPMNPHNVGLLERHATNEAASTVRVMSSIMRNSSVGGYDVITVIQYRPNEAWISWSRRWASSIASAHALASRETRTGFKTAVSRQFAASLHPSVYVPDTEDIDC